MIPKLYDLTHQQVLKKFDNDRKNLTNQQNEEMEEFETNLPNIEDTEEFKALQKAQEAFSRKENQLLFDKLSQSEQLKLKHSEQHEKMTLFQNQVLSRCGMKICNSCKTPFNTQIVEEKQCENLECQFHDIQTHCGCQVKNVNIVKSFQNQQVGVSYTRRLTNRNALIL
jgi:hypothetical protein